MSVYTKITEEELSRHLLRYSIGKAVSLTGISDGIENTNYLLKTDKNEYIFTIFENIKKEDVGQYLDFMNHLSGKGLLCPNVLKSNKEELFIMINNKPSAIIQKLNGKSIVDTDVNSCEAIGNLLAEFHIFGSDFKKAIKNSRDIKWCIKSHEKLINVIKEDQSKLILKSIDIQRELSTQSLPIGTIHADLFRDNVLFKGNDISGMIDFYYSCQGFLIYDLAVVVNDWCTSKNGTIVTEEYNRLTSSYVKKRNIIDLEKKYWGHALVSAALRFYLSRLLDLHFPKIGEMTHIKDPLIFENILKDRINTSYLI